MNAEKKEIIGQLKKEKADLENWFIENAVFASMKSRSFNLCLDKSLRIKSINYLLNNFTL